MKDQTNIVRWGIPGWTAMVALLLFVIVETGLTGDTTLFESVDKAFSSQSGFTAIVTAILVAGAGVPLGFLIYQIYYYIRWSSPPSMNGLLPPFITGRAKEMEEVLADFGYETLSFGKPWRRKILPKPLESNYLLVSHYFDALFSESLVQLDNSGVIVARHKYILDMIHTLGASQVGLALGFGGFLLLKSYLGTLGEFALLIALLIIGTTLILLAIEEEVRINNPVPFFREVVKIRNERSTTWEAFWSRVVTLFARAVVQFSKIVPIKFPSELFIVGLFFLSAIYDPRLTTLVVPAWFAIFVSLLVVTYRRVRLWFCGLGTLLVLAVAIPLIPGCDSFLSSRHWEVILSSLVFSSLTIAILKNRQNARDILKVFERYSLNRFNEIQDKSGQQPGVGTVSQEK